MGGWPRHSGLQSDRACCCVAHPARSATITSHLVMALEYLDHGAAALRSSPGMAGGRQSTVEIEGGADERQVRERLGEVAEVLRLVTELLAVEPEVIRVAQHLLEEEARFVQVAHAREALDIPEGAHRKRAF